VIDDVAARVRMVATDLDGTVLDDQHRISDRTVEAFQQVEASGRHVVFVTGRPPRSLAKVADRMGHTGMAVAANGAIQYDLASETVVAQRLLAPETACRIVGMLREVVPGFAFAVERPDGLAHEPGYERFSSVVFDPSAVLAHQHATGAQPHPSPAGMAQDALNAFSRCFMTP
jgi:hydroxymethylpyrimidine pyrophosphatase-like HAD family hydrolase